MTGKEYLSIYDLAYKPLIKRLNEYNIYSDESMNLRRVWIKDSTKEELKYKFFVLGGVEVPDGCDLEKVKDLFIDDDFPKDELKYGYFSYGSGKFYKALKSKRLNKLFRFILDNKILIHINVLNYWYWAICDIVDSIEVDKIDYKRSVERKMGLYEALMAYYDETYSIFVKYDFPSIKHGNEKAFLFEILRILKKSIDEKFKQGDEEYQSIVDLINLVDKRIGSTNKLPFIQDETPLQIVDTLANVYVQTAYFFKYNGMIFDNETKIEEELNSVSPDLIKELNCKFIDSKTSIAIQLSDVIVGFVARLFEFVSNIDEVDRFCNNLKTGSVFFNNMSLFKEILKESTDLYEFNYCRQISMHQEATLCRFLDIMSYFEEL